jgi:superfamily I DNA/RNA helicase
MRIGYLIEEKGVSPSRIKAVTFSNAAASDMKKRFTRFFPNHPKCPEGRFSWYMLDQKDRENRPHGTKFNNIVNMVGVNLEL